MRKKQSGIGRRDFLKFSGALVAGTTVAIRARRAMAAAPPTEVIFASAPFFSKASIEAILDTYNNAQTAVHATYLELPSAADPVALHANLAQRLKKGEGAPDIFSLDVVRVAEFATAGLSLPLGKYFDSATMSGFFQGIVQGCTVNGELRAFPWFADCGMLFYRHDILDKLGEPAPETWGDLAATARKAMGADTPYGFLWQGKKSESLVCNLVSIIGSNGGTILDAAGNVRIDEPAAVDAVQFLYDTIHRLKISPADVLTFDEEPCRKPFNAGKAVFLRNWSYTWGLAQQGDSQVIGKVGVAPLPHFPGKASAACLGGYQLAINGRSKKTDAAIDFLRWLSTSETQLRFAVEDGLAPTRQAVFADSALAKAQPFLAQLRDVFAGALARPVTAAYPKVTLAIQSEVWRGLSSGKVADALSVAAQKIKAIPTIGRG